MTDDALRFTEIEHKFIVNTQFDLSGFRDTLAGLGPTRTTTTQVQDRYFLTETGRGNRFLIRHRYDSELHQLTLKTLEADTEIRSEINLDLDHGVGDQQDAVDALLDRLGTQWRGNLHKDLNAWYFADMEIVHYHATSDTHALTCVEFEAIHAPSVDAALTTLRRYEQATGFAGAPRATRSLPQLLFPELAAALEE